MAIALKKFVVVGYHTSAEAKCALDSAVKFFHSGFPRSSDLSYQKENIVYFYLTDNSRKNEVETFLLEQPGAQPKGHRHKA